MRPPPRRSFLSLRKRSRPSSSISREMWGHGRFGGDLGTPPPSSFRALEHPTAPATSPPAQTTPHPCSSP
eukprot:scaffold18593_cov115-Isochrysis_galbana.AAC.1